MSRVRVLIVDDHAILRAGLRAVLAGDAAMTVVGEAADGLEACELAAVHRPDIVLMDISMPRLNGPAATVRMLTVSPESKVIALTMHDEAPYVRQCLRAGAKGYVLKRTIVRDLLQAIHTVARGGVYLDPELSRGSSARTAFDPATDAVELTAHEMDVASLSALGHSNPEIASRLSIASKTVETHKTRMMAKLGLQTRAQLVRYAIHRGWLSS